jgi:hypothetical protein|tara:strand:- start:174 stop:371 length:198 start_codon:yes stop_codon:yes gene_type:complete
MSNYRPYSPEWNRKRYLTEAIQTYFNDDIDVEVIVDDINCALEEQRDYYLGRAEKLDAVIAGLNK